MRSSTDARLVPCCITQEHVPQQGCQWGRGRSPSTSSLPLYMRSYELLQLLLPLLSCSLSMTRITKITLTLLVLPADGFIVPASPRSLWHTLPSSHEARLPPPGPAESAYTERAFPAVSQPTWNSGLLGDGKFPYHRRIRFQAN